MEYRVLAISLFLLLHLKSITVSIQMSKNYSPKIWTRVTNMHLTYVPTFLSSWMLNRYISRAKLHLISRKAGRYTSNWRGVGLFKAFDTHANGKLPPKFWTIKGNISMTVLAKDLTEVTCVKLKRQHENTTLTATLAWIAWYNSSASLSEISNLLWTKSIVI